MKISVVIPVLNEAETIESVIARLAAAARGAEGVAECDAHEIEVIVVDGGSQDASVAKAQRAGVRVIASAPGRARQLQAGAAVARGEVLLFLHADTWLAPGFAPVLAHALADTNTVGGAFRFALDAHGLVFRAIEWGTHLRNWVWNAPYGDQALFVRRNVFEAIGGVPQTPIFEDVDLVRAMKRKGRVVIVALPAVTSARRYARGGVWRTALGHRAAVLADALGIERERIAAWLRRSPPASTSTQKCEVRR